MSRTILTMIMAVTTTCMSASCGTRNNGAKVVAITQFTEHELLDSLRRGLIDQLRERGYEPEKNLRIVFQSAQGDFATAAQIASQFVRDRPDVIVAFTTPSSLAVAGATSTIPVVVGAITDPIGAGLVSNLERPGGNITGTTDRSPIRQQMKLLREITPNVRKLGCLFNSAEHNSVFLVGLLRQTCSEMGLELVEATVANSGDVMLAARSLARRVDALYVLSDSTVLSALPMVIDAGMNRGVPVYSADPQSVEDGALASIGFSYYELGRRTGEIVARILDGSSPGDLPFLAPERLELHVNADVAKQLRIAIPSAVLGRADRIVGEGN